METQHFLKQAFEKRYGLLRPREGRIAPQTRPPRHAVQAERRDRNDALSVKHRSANGGADRGERSVSSARQQRDVQATAKPPDGINPPQPESGVPGIGAAPLEF